MATLLSLETGRKKGQHDLWREVNRRKRPRRRLTFLECQRESLLLLLLLLLVANLVQAIDREQTLELGHNIAGQRSLVDERPRRDIIEARPELG